MRTAVGISGQRSRSSDGIGRSFEYGGLAHEPFPEVASEERAVSAIGLT